MPIHRGPSEHMAPYRNAVNEMCAALEKLEAAYHEQEKYYQKNIAGFLLTNEQKRDWNRREGQWRTQKLLLIKKSKERHAKAYGKIILYAETLEGNPTHSNFVAEVERLRIKYTNTLERVKALVLRAL